jgi:acyl-CoA thioester hydrolase
VTPQRRVATDRPTPRVHVNDLRVIYGDTDQMGFAYYANYLRWFEVARNEFLRDLGYTYRRLEEDGIILPVVEANVRYQSPAYYDDLLHVESWIEELGRVRVRFAYRIVRDGEAVPLATGFTVHASLGRGSSPSRLPASFLAALQRYEADGPRR